MTETIANTTIRMISPNGEAKGIDVQIGKPYVISNGEAACRIAINGLYSKIPDLHGVDTFQAVALAFEFVRLTIVDY